MYSQQEGRLVGLEGEVNLYMYWDEVALLPRRRKRKIGPSGWRLAVRQASISIGCHWRMSRQDFHHEKPVVVDR